MPNILKLTSLLIVASLSGLSLGNSKTSIDEMLLSYSALEYGQSVKYAMVNQDTYEGRLVLALCLIHSPDHQDLLGAFSIFEELCADEVCPVAVRVEALMSYGRVAQLVKDRPEVYGNVADDMDFIGLFKKVIELAPESREACQAAVFIATHEFSSADETKRDQAFLWLEKFCSDFTGNGSFLVPVHLFLEYRYIVLRKDYESSLRHLIAALGAGITNPKDKTITLYRIARIYDTRLNDRKNALKYYRKFLTAYPESAYTPMVKRFEMQLQETAQNVKN